MGYIEQAAEWSSSYGFKVKVSERLYIYCLFYLLQKDLETAYKDSFNRGI